RCEYALPVLRDPAGKVRGRVNSGQHLLAAGLEAVVGARCPDAGKIAVEPADVVGDGHLVVVEDDQHVGPAVGGVVEGLEGHAGGHRTVADDGQGAPVADAVASRQGPAHGGAITG